MPKRHRFDWLLQEFVPIKPYTGELAKPPTWTGYNFMSDFAWWGPPKLEALLDHYGINGTNRAGEGKWFILAMQLALEHVPNFVPVNANKGGKNSGAHGRKEEDRE